MRPDLTRGQIPGGDSMSETFRAEVAPLPWRPAWAARARLEEVRHRRGGGLAAQRRQDVERVLGQGQFGVGHRRPRDTARRRSTNVRADLHRHQRVVDALEHEERAVRRPGPGRSARRPGRARGASASVIFITRLLEHARAGPGRRSPGRRASAVRSMHAVEGDAGLHRGVRVLEARAGRPDRPRSRASEAHRCPPAEPPLTATKAGSPPYSPMCSFTQATAAWRRRCGRARSPWG